MSSNLRNERPEAMRHVMIRVGRKDSPQTPPQAREVLPLCQ